MPSYTIIIEMTTVHLIAYSMIGLVLAEHNISLPTTAHNTQPIRMHKEEEKEYTMNLDQQKQANEYSSSASYSQQRMYSASIAC